MAVTGQKIKFTAEQYLERERKALTKSEFFQGEIFAMSGASRNHNVIAGNLFAALHPLLKSKNCRQFNSDMRIHIPANTLYTYPDISVVCDKEEFLDGEFDTLLNPVFIAEILSPSTADYDTGRKFMLYRSVVSLKEYWAISSTEFRLQQFLKTDENTWVLHENLNKTGTINLSSAGVSLSLEEIYEGFNL